MEFIILLSFKAIYFRSHQNETPCIVVGKWRKFWSLTYQSFNKVFEILTGCALQNFSKDGVQIVRTHLSDLNVHSISNRVGQRLNSFLYFSIKMGILTIYKKPDLFWTLLNYYTLKLWSHPFQHRESRCGEFYTYLCLNTYMQ